MGVLELSCFRVEYQEYLPGSSYQFQVNNKMEGRIVADDAVASQRLPSVELKDVSSQGKSVFTDRCDSGFSSGLGQPYSSQQITELKVPPTAHPKYDRLDSGYECEISSNLKDLEIEKPVKRPQPPKNEEFRQLYEADKGGDCQLHLAIASGWSEVVFALIRMAPHPAYLDIQNNELYAPLHIAVLMNQPTMVRRLVVAGATNDIRDHEGNTPLHLASKRGYLECAEALLRSISVEELREASVASRSGQGSGHQLHRVTGLPRQEQNKNRKTQHRECRSIMKDSFTPSRKVCSVTGSRYRYADGAEQVEGCNACVCACGKWVCTDNICNDDDDDEEAPEDDPDVQSIRWF